MQNFQPETRRIFQEVEKLLALCLSLPVSAADSERSFSTLRRLKTYLRGTMSQQRLTHLALMNVHQNILDENEDFLHEIMKEFCSRTYERADVYLVPLLRTDSLIIYI